MAKRLSTFLVPSTEKIPDDRRRSYAYSPESFGQPPYASAPRRVSDPYATNRSSETLRQPLVDTPQLRKSPAQQVQHHVAAQPSLQQLRHDFFEEGLPLNLAPPQPVYASSQRSRSPSADRSRPMTPSSRASTPTEKRRSRISSLASNPQSDKPVDDEAKRRTSWFSKNKDITEKSSALRAPQAWIAGHAQKQPYDLEHLWSGRLLPELSRDEDANCYVHLWPKDSHKGPSMRIDSTVFAASPLLSKLAFGDAYDSTSKAGKGRPRASFELQAQNLSLSDNRRSASPSLQGSSAQSISSLQSASRTSTTLDRPDCRIYLPLKLSPQGLAATHLPASLDQALGNDIQTLVDFRNVFAFLCGQSLIATPQKSSFFHIFMTIAAILKSYEFSNADGSTFGEVASESFECYLSELSLGDVRNNVEKTLQGLVLGERMKSVTLYNEAFTHAAGQYHEVVAANSPIWELLHPITQNRLARASMDLEKRLVSVQIMLTDFDFPALFTGIMNSKTSEERKEGVKFDGWRTSFLAMRKYVIGLYQSKYGHWPPRASSKKNNLETSGLNRRVLQDMYRDMTSMYDLVCDRTRLTTRLMEGDDLGAERDEPMVRALRSVLAEYDRSSPPVKPPVPFDLPKFPVLEFANRPYQETDPRVVAKAANKKLKDDDITQVLRHSCNRDAHVTPFVDAFRDFERHAAHGGNISQICDQRIGHWIFMYVVLQALPMLACDAPGLKYTSGVEYFLCEPPRSVAPWMVSTTAGNSGNGVERKWFTVTEGGGMVSLPADIVEHGVEGIFRRSHCWVMAQKWSASNPALSTALHRQESINAMTSARINERMPDTPELAGAPFLRPDVARRPSPSRLPKQKSYLGLGLEALPVPAGITPGSRSSSAGNSNCQPSAAPQGSRSVTPLHTVDTSKTFDSILAAVDTGKKGKKKK